MLVAVLKKTYKLFYLPKVTSSGEFLKGSEKWMGLASPLIILICCRLLRSLNQTGVQWAHRPDFGHWLTRWVSELDNSYYLLKISCLTLCLAKGIMI